MERVLKALKSVKFNQNLDIAAYELRVAHALSLEINKKFDIEKILDIIFKDFCIGK
jgi:tRNA U34 5-carboxymethylaminomethyl modifying GTPase MnmE/TrmE